MKNLPLLIVTIIGTLALIIGVAVAFSNSASKGQSVDQAQLVGDGRLSVGPSDAKVTIVEFSDFQCPYCAGFAPTLKAVQAKHPDSVRVIYRHFPLITIHPYAQISAQAGEAAHQEGKFWEFAEVLFARQSQWAALGSQDEVTARFVEYAGELGIDKASFQARIQSDSVKTAVSQDVGYANQIGVDSTPTVYINGEKLSAPQQLESTVEKLLQSN